MLYYAIFSKKITWLIFYENDSYAPFFQENGYIFSFKISMQSFLSRRITWILISYVKFPWNPTCIFWITSLWLTPCLHSTWMDQITLFPSLFFASAYTTFLIVYTSILAGGFLSTRGIWMLWDLQDNYINYTFESTCAYIIPESMYFTIPSCDGWPSSIAHNNLLE